MSKNSQQQQQQQQQRCKNDRENSINVNQATNNERQVSHMDSSSKLSKKSGVVERLDKYFLNSALSDVTFLINYQNESSYGERIPAHKFILSIGSPVFQAMFYGSGTQMNISNEIEIIDVECVAFKSLLRFVYTDEVILEPDYVMSVLYASKKYNVASLEKECVEYLKRNLRVDNVFMLLSQARLFDETELAESCLEIIDKYASEVFTVESFYDLDMDLLASIVKRDTLGIKESNLFQFLLKWSQAQCKKQDMPMTRENQKRVLGDLVKQIRFPVMSKEEFALAMNSHESRVISDDQIIDLFLNFTLNNPKKHVDFVDRPRCCLGGREQAVNRFAQVESRWGYSGTSDRLRFLVDKRIIVVGLGLYGSIYGKCEYQVLIQLIHFDSCATLAQNNTSFMCDGTNTTFRVLFKEPIEIEPNTEYIVAATLKGPDSYYGTKGLRVVHHENLSGNRVTFQFQYASGNNNGSSVEDGQLPEILFLYTCN